MSSTSGLFLTDVRFSVGGFQHASEVYGYEPENTEIQSFESAPNSFTCKRLNKRVSWAGCIESFVDVNAKERKNSPCFKCPVGSKVREAFAEERLTKCFHRTRAVLNNQPTAPKKTDSKQNKTNKPALPTKTPKTFLTPAPEPTKIQIVPEPQTKKPLLSKTMGLSSFFCVSQAVITSDDEDD